MSSLPVSLWRIYFTIVKAYDLPSKALNLTIGKKLICIEITFSSYADIAIVSTSARNRVMWNQHVAGEQFKTPLSTILFCQEYLSKTFPNVVIIIHHALKAKIQNDSIATLRASHAPFFCVLHFGHGF